MTAARRIGLYGGSFDPVHRQHLALARTALVHLQLDELCWVPVGQAWHKQRVLTDGEHRAAMIERAIVDEPRYRLERCELERAGPSYTIDTLDLLRGREPSASWFLVIGEDQYRSLPSWHAWQRLVAHVTLAVAVRPLAGDAAQAPRAVPSAPPALAAQPHRVVTLPLPPLDLSSTAVRDAVAAGDDRRVAEMVPPAVASYIALHHLYLPEAR